MSRKKRIPSDNATPWHFLALSDAELERTDLLRLNLAVAQEIPALADLDVGRYARIVDEWARQFARVLPGMEAQFRRTPEKWNNDIRFFRVGMLQGFLGHEIGLQYIDEQKYAAEVRYTNPSDLFLNGLIDTKRGTCGNMPVLHVAMARRMGWPVSLACAKSHQISRFDDGEVVHNIEATSTHPGSFASDPDEVYIERFSLPRKAIECGSDLRKLTAREMVGVFLGLRGRHYSDVGDMDQADQSYALARVLFPQHRKNYIAALVPMLRRGEELFEPDELGHPDSLFEDVAPGVVPNVGRPRPSRAAAVEFLVMPSLNTPVPPEMSFSSGVVNAMHPDLQRK